MIQNPAELREIALSPFRQDHGNILPVTSSAASLMLTGNAMERMFTFAEWMSKGKVAVPQHLLGNTSDCLAVVMQAMQWDMNPFQVAQKTYLAKGGKLNYEAQLISAVIATSPLADSLPSYEFIGDWTKVLGKFEKCRGDNGDFFKATYTALDEVGLGVICRMKIKGEAAPRELTVMLLQCQPRFSTQWATDPMQQITYVAIRKWGRQNTPGVILGVYGEDEFEQSAPAAAPAAPRDMGAAVIVETKGPEPLQPPQPLAADHPVILAGYAAARIGRAEFDAWWAAVDAGLRGAAHPHLVSIKAAGKEAHEKREAAAAALAAQAEKAKPAATGADGAPTVTYASIMDALNKAHAANDIEALGTAADLIGAIQDAAQRDELEKMFVNLNGELMAATA